MTASSDATPPRGLNTPAPVVPPAPEPVPATPHRQDSRHTDSSLHPKHIGILVIHGIGEENPYGPLDAFARGLYRYFHDPGQKPLYTLHTQWKQRGPDPSHTQKSWTQAQIRFLRSDDADITGFPAAPHRLTVAEYYWSPVTKGKMKDLDVLTWLIRTALEPFRYISENLQAMIAVRHGRMSLVQQARHRRNLALREIFRLAVLYPLFLGSFMALAGFLAGVGNLPAVLKNIAASPKNILIGLFLATRLLVLVSLSGYFLNFIKWRNNREPGSSAPRRTVSAEAGPDPARRFNAQFLILATLFALALLALPIFVAGAWRPPHLLPNAHFASFTGFGWTTRILHRFLPGQDSLWRLFAVLPAWIRQLWQWLLAYLGQLVMLVPPFTSTLLTIPLAELAIAAGIRSFLINYAGDVAIYTNLNQRSANFAVRSQILEECGNAVTTLYCDLREEAIDERAGANATPEQRQKIAQSLTPEDFQIVVAAHSLGTVIGYDTICNLFNRARIAEGAPGAPIPQPGHPVDPSSIQVATHLRGMLTFGSPLNKTYYFFRDQSDAEELIRAQIVDDLHLFRQASPAANLAGAPLCRVPIPHPVLRLMDDFCWVNVWSHADVISGELLFYRANHQYSRPYRIPILAHLFYWNDPALYNYLALHLL